MEASDADPIVRSRPLLSLRELGLTVRPRSNITRLEEWCKSHDMPEGTLQLEHLMQATKLLQLKKVRSFAFCLPTAELSLISLSRPPSPTSRSFTSETLACFLP